MWLSFLIWHHSARARRSSLRGRRVTAVLEGGELVPGRCRPLGLGEEWASRGVRVEFDGLLVAGDGLVQLALVLQRNAQVGVGLGELRVEFDGLPVAGDGLVQLALVLSAVPRLLWAMASFGSSSMAFL